MAGTDAGFGVRSGGHADVIRWGRNTRSLCQSRNCHLSLDKNYGCSVQGAGWADETDTEVLIEGISETSMGSRASEWMKILSWTLYIV